MSADLISVIDIASRHGTRKQTVFKVVRRLGIATTKLRSSSHRNQLVAHITESDYARLKAELMVRGPAAVADPYDDGFVSDEVGVFYLVQLEPELDPGRVKVGFAVNMSERLRALRCSAPMSAVVRTWPCRRLWEKTAIDCVTAGCERLHTEVFRAESVAAVQSKCDQFFALFGTVAVST